MAAGQKIFVIFLPFLAMPPKGSKAKIQIQFPEKLWFSLTKKYPYLQFSIKAFVPIEQDPFVGNSLILVQGQNFSQFLQDLEKHPSLISYSIMEKNSSSMILNTYTKDQFLLKSIVKNLILVELPVSVNAGVAEFNISSSRQNIDKFITELESKGLSITVKYLGTYETDPISHLLTPRQHEVYTQAKKKGYYNSPREITLTELAEQLNMAKSSLSSMLQRIHSKLLGNIEEKIEK